MLGTILFFSHSFYIVENTNIYTLKAENKINVKETWKKLAGQ